MRYFVFILVLCAILFEDACAKKEKNRKIKYRPKYSDTKIVGGYNTTIQECPHQAFLLLTKEENDNYQCGGSIISTKFILSAAHCFVDGVKKVQARIGSTDKFFGGQEYPGTFTIHEDYNHITKDYDIAYVETDQEMVLDGVNTKIISIIEEGTAIPSGSILKISGWGATSEGGDASENLMAVEVPTLSNEECNKIQTITDRQFCGGYKEGGKDSCQGDSGGPAVLSDSGILCGVVSAGHGCARPNSPGYYTNLTDPPIRSWILQHTGV